MSVFISDKNTAKLHFKFFRNLNISARMSWSTSEDSEAVQ